MTGKAPLRFKPRLITTLPTVSDYHFLIHAHQRRWRSTAGLIGLTQLAAYRSRRRLIYHGLLELNHPTKPMKWTHATYSLIKRARAFGPITLPPYADQHWEG